VPKTISFASPGMRVQEMKAMVAQIKASYPNEEEIPANIRKLITERESEATASQLTFNAKQLNVIR
jgi:hypothetical protein